MHVFVKQQGKDQVRCECDASDTVDTIVEQLGLDSGFRLYFRSKYLDRSATLGEFGLEAGATLNAFPRVVDATKSSAEVRAQQRVAKAKGKPRSYL